MSKPTNLEKVAIQTVAALKRERTRADKVWGDILNRELDITRREVKYGQTPRQRRATQDAREKLSLFKITENTRKLENEARIRSHENAAKEGLLEKERLRVRKQWLKAEDNRIHGPARREAAKWQSQIRKEERRREGLPEKARLRQTREGFKRDNWEHGVAAESEARKWDREIASEERRRQNPFEVTKIRSNSNTRFTTFFDVCGVKVNHYPFDTSDVFKKAADLTIAERGLVAGDKIRIIVSHPSWRKPFSTKLLTVTHEDFLHSLTKIISEFMEYKDVSLDEVTIEVQSTKVPRGRGRLRIDKHNLELKKSIISINNTDSICLARAIVTAAANINRTKWTKSQIKNGFNGSRKLQGVEAHKLHEEAGVDINEFGSTLEDVNRFAEHLGIQINIVDGDHFGDLIHTTGGGDMIYLYKSGNHFDVISSMTGFTCKDHYRHTCKKGYKTRDEHRCPSKCLACFKSDSGCVSKGEDSVVCDKCSSTFFGQTCFEEHKRDRGVKDGKADIVCRIVQKCLACMRTTKDLSKHKCGYHTCSNCKAYDDPNTHKCHMLRKDCKGGECTHVRSNEAEVPCLAEIDDKGNKMSRGK